MMCARRLPLSLLGRIRRVTVPGCANSVSGGWAGLYSLIH
jgi:hypothetical protein